LHCPVHHLWLKLHRLAHRPWLKLHLPDHHLWLRLHRAIALIKTLSGVSNRLKTRKRTWQKTWQKASMNILVVTEMTPWTTPLRRFYSK